jgi:hypothetical protein
MGSAEISDQSNELAEKRKRLRQYGHIAAWDSLVERRIIVISYSGNFQTTESPTCRGCAAMNPNKTSASSVEPFGTPLPQGRCPKYQNQCDGLL